VYRPLTPPPPTAHIHTAPRSSPHCLTHTRRSARLRFFAAVRSDVGGMGNRTASASAHGGH
jgi:hypothetical protein